MEYSYVLDQRFFFIKVFIKDPGSLYNYFQDDRKQPACPLFSQIMKYLCHCGAKQV